jgi:hypothetical protein
MFEDMAVSAVQMLIVTFWIVLIVLVIWGALWLRSLKHLKPSN